MEYTQYYESLEAPERYENPEDRKLRLISQNEERQKAAKEFENKKLLQHQQNSITINKSEDVKAISLNLIPIFK